MFESGKALKFIEEDNYENGCNPETSQSYTVEIEFKAETIPELLNQITEYYGVDIKDIEINSCGENGRIDIGIMEDQDSNKASKKDLELFKQGRKRLWYSVYTYYIEEVTREAIEIIAA